MWRYQRGRFLQRGSMGKFFVFCLIYLKICFWLYKKRRRTSCKFKLEITSNKKVLAKKPLTNLYEMNSTNLSLHAETSPRQDRTGRWRPPHCPLSLWNGTSGVSAGDQGSGHVWALSGACPLHPPYLGHSPSLEAWAPLPVQDWAVSGDWSELKIRQGNR